MHSANCTEAQRFHSAVLGYGVDAPVVFQLQVPGLVQPVLKTVEVPQLQHCQGVRFLCFAGHRQGLDIFVILHQQVRAVPGDSRRCLRFRHDEFEAVFVRILRRSRNAWFDSGYMFCISSRDAFGRIYSFLYVKEYTRLLRSIHVFLSTFEVTALDVDCIWQTFSAVWKLLEWIFWEPSTTKSSSLSRARGGGVAGVSIPR